MDTEIPSKPTSIWLCLYCGISHCGRYDKEHAKSHFESDRQHGLVVNVETVDFWYVEIIFDKITGVIYVMIKLIPRQS